MFWYFLVHIFVRTRVRIIHKFIEISIFHRRFPGASTTMRLLSGDPDNNLYRIAGNMVSAVDVFYRV